MTFLHQAIQLLAYLFTLSHKKDLFDWGQYEKRKTAC